jgi:hypothetical protein
VALNVPWLIAFLWCLRTIASTGGVAGEIFLIPLAIWMFTGPVAIYCTINAWADTGSHPGAHKGRWIVCLGLLLMAAPLVLGIAENLCGSVRQAEINRRE